MMEVDVQLRCKNCTLSVGELDETHSTEGNEILGGVRIKVRLHSMECNVVDECVSLMQLAQYFLR